MRLYTFTFALVAAVALAAPAHAQNNPFLGAWNITGDAPNQNYVYWLEVKDEGGKPTALFLNRGGHAVPVEGLKLSGNELSFLLPGKATPRPSATFHAAGGKITGTITGAQTVKVSGERPPQWGPCDANAKHTFGKPVALFDGKSLDAWDVQQKAKPMGWSLSDGAMTNQPHANNLVSKEKFKDFRLDAEYKLSPKGNSGIYLRGRYELQVLDDAGQETFDRGHLSVYGRKKPDVNASKPAGEWQTLQVTLVGNCVTATLNGKTVHDNARITGITGGALDAKETEAGPIMIQGDHEVVWFRKVILTPITSGGGTK
ncbi:MAG: 3-keto-disaccharide hydrolase [Vicinamibacterales bacterium]